MVYYWRVFAMQRANNESLRRLATDYEASTLSGLIMSIGRSLDGAKGIE